MAKKKSTRGQAAVAEGKSPQPRQSPTAAAGNGIPIVAIGASAGGLDAFKKFFAAMPGDSGVGFVLVPHLDPTHRSLMVELLARQTPMRVVEAEHGMPVEPNRVYIIPPNRLLSIDAGRLQLEKPTEAQARQPAIDQFFRSLAHDQLEKAIGVILSGTGSHGVLGLKEIKLVGGMVMAQEPTTAEYDQMPRSAIRTGMVDFVLPPEQMPQALIHYVEHPYLNDAGGPAAADAPPDHLNQILDVLRAGAKYDFRHYRRNMVLRRTQRRMGLRQVEELPDYVRLLRESPDEVAALYKDLLIGVTGFFRDPEAFQVLEQRVMPDLVQRQKEGVPVRVWVPACATGEEAYSIAMLLLEAFSRADKPARLQVFASDIDEDSLHTARLGTYPETVAEVVSPERLDRFFVRSDEHYFQVKKLLRESIVFAPQNVISETPFSKIDLISCRNLLIYLEREIQEKIVSLFHFALNEQGFLFLGPSEMVGGHTDLFGALSKKWRVFRRLGPTRRGLADFPVASMENRRLPYLPVEPPRRPPKGLEELTQRLLLAEYAPAAVLVNRKYEVLYFFGPTSDYLQIPPGEPTKDLLAMARHGLQTKIRAACHRVLLGNEAVAAIEGRVLRNRAYTPCLITVKPLSEPREAEGLLLVTFQDRKSAAGEGPREPLVPEAEDSDVVKQLEFELKTSREDLQSTIEELESSNEELRASNEEVMSMNEELHSANEELQASKEELQSLNEELNTVNNELTDKLADLERANSDVINLLTGSDIATVFLDTKLQIRRFSPATAKLMNLMAGDIGRPLSDLAPRFTDDHLLDDCREVLQTLKPAEAEARTQDGRLYLRRILAYRTSDNRIEGVGITFVDITDRKRDADALRQEHALIEGIIDTAQQIILLLSTDGRILRFNPFLEQLTGWRLDEVRGRDWFETFLPERDREITRGVFGRAFAGERTRGNINPILTRDGQEREIEWHDAPLTDPDGTVIGLVCTGQDITHRRQAEQTLRESRARLKAIVDTAADAVITIDQRGTIDWVNPTTERMFGYTAGELVGRNVKVLMPPPFRDEHDGYLRRYLETGEAKIIGIGRELEGRRKDGTVFPIDLAVSELHDQAGKMFTGIIRDVTDRKAEHERLIQSERLAALGEAMAGLTHESRNALARSQGNLQRLARRLKGDDELLQLIDGALMANDDIRRQFEEVRQYAAPLNLRPEPTDLRELVRQAWDELADEREDRPAELRMPEPECDVSCEVDRFSLRNAFRNTLENSIAACTDRIEIDTAMAADQIDGQPALRISICDNGPGLPPEAMQRAFDAFFTTKTRGTGLGLAIVRRTVEAHGGQVAFGTGKGRGAELIITLPRKRT